MTLKWINQIGLKTFVLYKYIYIHHSVVASDLDFLVEGF